MQFLFLALPQTHCVPLSMLLGACQPALWAFALAAVVVCGKGMSIFACAIKCLHKGTFAKDKHCMI